MLSLEALVLVFQRELRAAFMLRIGIKHTRLHKIKTLHSVISFIAHAINMCVYSIQAASCGTIKFGDYPIPPFELLMAIK